MSGFAHDANDTELVYSQNVDFSGGVTPTGQITTNAQMLIGTTALNAGGTHINVGTITSPLGTLTLGFSTPNITIDLAGGAQAVQHLTGNTGGQLNPIANNFNILTANSTPVFAGVAATLTLDFGLSNLLLGSSGSTIAGGIRNSGFGGSSLQNVTSGNRNTAVGFFAGNALTTGGDNILIGFTAGGSGVITGSANVVVGSEAGGALTSGTANILIGFDAGLNINTGSTNIIIGPSDGLSYTTNSNNILLNHIGLISDNNVMRLGTTGTGTNQVSQTHIAGVINTVSGRVVKITTPGAYPYATLITDYVILVDSSAARTINPIAAPVTGTTYRIKDSVGSAGTNNITITPTGQNIDGVASYVINTNYGSADIVYSGAEWKVI